MNEKKIEQWDVWMADFPFEDSTETKVRPVVVISVEPLEVFSIKVTTHEPRDYYDVVIQKWKEAGLRYPSVARISKMAYLSIDKFEFKLGTLDMEDKINILAKINERLERI